MNESKTTPGKGLAPTVRADSVFAMPPMDLLQDRMLLPTDRVIASLLAGIAGQSYLCWPCNQTLATMAGCSKRTVIYSLNRLEAVGWIQRKPAATTRRGSVIYLLWRRPSRTPSKTKPTNVGGVQSVARGDATDCTGGVQPVASNRSRFKEEEELNKEAPSAPQENGPPTPEEMAMWRDWARSPRHPFNRTAREIVAEYDRAESARNEKPPAGDRLAVTRLAVEEPHPCE